MSRVAEALERANRAATLGTTVTEDDHPWTDELSSAGSSEVTSETQPIDVPWNFAEPARAAGHQADARAGTPLAAAAVIVEPARSALDGLGARVHQQLAALVERVFLPVAGTTIRSVAFAGIGPGTTSGVITAAVAEMLVAQTTSTVCAVDANFRYPSLHECFGVSNTDGLSDALQADRPMAECARQLRSNLWVIPAGRSERPPLVADRSRMQVAQLIASFDYLLVDTALAADVGAASGLAPLMDGVILVLDADATRRDSAQRVARLLQASGAATLGAILTNRRYPVPDAIYRRL